MIHPIARPISPDIFSCVPGLSRLPPHCFNRFVLLWPGMPDLAEGGMPCLAVKVILIRVIQVRPL